MADGSVNILVAGEAGQGLVTVGDLLTRSLVRSGYFVHVTQDYQSRIRGGHNSFAIRAATCPVEAPVDEIDILVALNQESIDLHRGQVKEGGLLLLGESLDLEGECVIRIPFADLASKPLFHNVAALGALASVIGLDREAPAGLLRKTFGKKGEEVVRQNLEVLEKSYDWATSQGRCRLAPLPPLENPRSRLMLTANEAIALGAMAAGVKFCSFYPMTPSTSVALTLAAKGPGLGIMVEQAEDEIAALNMGLGAAFAGARTIVPTSGGGFALMVEAVSLAGMIEQPIVIALIQRPGPATGLPTRTEQGDLNLALYAGHGEFPRAIFAPGAVEDFFHLTIRAFDQAEKWQSPAFVLGDQYMADSYRAVEPFDLDALPEIAGPDLSDEGAEGYERYALAPSGVSPRRIPGYGRSLVLADSDEHTPDGHITEDLAVRTAMVEKRLRKGCGLAFDALPPEYAGDESPDLLLVNWGSSRGAVLEAAEVLRREGSKVGCLHFSQVWPLDPDGFLSRLQAAGDVVCVEGNASGQFADLLAKATGLRMPKRVLRYDGLPFTARYILDALGTVSESLRCL
ncbi:MAG: 2-oxoacid:acceptor oxidoreductase subunit alpha [Thermodesulfobacteriota bacterium]